jgi:hypothetical protein
LHEMLIVDSILVDNVKVDPAGEDVEDLHEL